MIFRIVYGGGVGASFIRPLSGGKNFSLVRRRSSNFFVFSPCPLFSMRVISSDTKEFRLGVCVRRTLGSAVLRNRIRRRIREAFRGLQHEKLLGHWVIVTGLNATLEKWPFSSLQNMLLQGIKQNLTSRKRRVNYET